MPALSILDLVPVPEGGTPREALQRSLRLAQAAERLGYTRFWVAEHHNMPGIASAATAVVIGYLAAGTRSIRLGAGGIMLPNHSPLVIAEQFGTLESLYPGRIDLGLGRAPGTDGVTVQALRRDPRMAEYFPDDVQELQALFGPVQPGQRVQAVPGAGLDVPLWILGSSLYGAQLAAALGLPYAFASHFAPDALDDALRVYRERYRPSARHPRPHAMIGVNVVVADTDAEARRLFTSAQQSYALLHRGQRGLQRPPVDDIEAFWTPAEKQLASRMLAVSVVGSPATVRAGLARLLARTRADELMVVGSVFDFDARLRSFELLAAVGRELGAAPGTASAA
ncbi:MAG: LLM class flavin-dependent oxidoreductase [Steroidobacteraceae bacterium]|jgi:luciferase family oxidoreductase group 1|nr:LLM class flavin-dependent oxidoreductase [Steroidobacteraceae bacterium]